MQLRYKSTFLRKRNLDRQKRTEPVCIFYDSSQTGHLNLRFCGQTIFHAAFRPRLPQQTKVSFMTVSQDFTASVGLRLFYHSKRYFKKVKLKCLWQLGVAAALVLTRSCIHGNQKKWFVVARLFSHIHVVPASGNWCWSSINLPMRVRCAIHTNDNSYRADGNIR